MVVGVLDTLSERVEVDEAAVDDLFPILASLTARAQGVKNTPARQAVGC